MKKLISIMLASAFSFTTQAAEVDQFTDRFSDLEDASALINQKANGFLEEGLRLYNESNESCDEEKLYAQLKPFFSNHKHGQLLHYILRDTKLPKRRLKVKDSIYADFTILDGYLLGKKSADESEVALGPLVRFGDKTVGSDKFEHLFGRGFAYFKNYYFKKKKIKKVFESGEFGEKTVYGGNIFATGVYSYADLVANFNGMRFWNNMLGLRPDILNVNIEPYVVCKNGKYFKNSSIDFGFYFDDGVDEGINCSRFATKKGARKISEKVKSLNLTKDGRSFSECPLFPEKIPALVEKYKDFSDRLINQAGHRKR